MRARIAWFLAIAVMLGACSSSSSSKSKSSPSTKAPAVTTRSSSVPAAAIGHVFVINLENKDFDATFGSATKATYLNQTLRPMGQLLSQYHGIGHNSLDNYIAQISGQSPNPSTQADCATYSDFHVSGAGAYGQVLGRGCVYPADVKTVADQLEVTHKTWKGYMEDMGNSSTAPKTCRHPAIGSTDDAFVAKPGDMYATRHNPFVYFHSIIDRGICDTNDVPLDRLPADLASESATPNLVYITPNLCNDGHDAPCADGQPGGLVSADRFLAAWVPKILASPAYRHDGMLIVTFDEAESNGAGADATACCNTPASPNAANPGLSGPGGGRVGAVVVSAKTKAGTTNATPYNHYALLCSIEDIFGLEHLGFAGTPGLRCFGKDVFDA